MSFFFESFSCKQSEINVTLKKKIPDASGVASRVDKRIFLSEDEATHAVYAPDGEKWKPYYALFIKDGDSLETAKIKQLRERAKQYSKKAANAQLEGLKKVCDKETKTCPHCGERISMSLYRVQLAAIKRDGYSVRLECKSCHCNDNMFPLNKGDADKVMKAWDKASELREDIDVRRLELAEKLSKKKGVEIMAHVGVWLHDSLLSEYPEEY